MDLKKRDLMILLDLLTTRSFTQSATRLGISQASLSKSIAGLENRFGISLLDRTVRPISPSLFCLELVPYIEGVIKAHSELDIHIQSHKKNPSGLVNIYCPIPFQIIILHEIIPLIKEKYPSIKLSIKTIRNNINDKTFGALFVDDCDILISFFKPRDEQLISRKLLEINYNIYTKADDNEVSRFSTLKDICLHDFILHTSFQNKNGTNDILLKKNNLEEKISVSGGIICDNVYSILNLTSKGLGLGYLPEILANRNARLKKILPEEYSSSLNVFINYPRKKLIPLRNSIVIDCMVEYFKSFDINDYMRDFSNPF